MLAGALLSAAPAPAGAYGETTRESAHPTVQRDRAGSGPADRPSDTVPPFCLSIGLLGGTRTLCPDTPDVTAAEDGPGEPPSGAFAAAGAIGGVLGLGAVVAFVLRNRRR